MSRLKPIRTEDEYDQALARIEALWDATPGSSEGDEMEALAILVEAYEKVAHPIPAPHPIEALRFARRGNDLQARKAGFERPVAAIGAHVGEMGDATLVEKGVDTARVGRSGGE